MSTPLTLLAPARDLQVGRAAIRAGADAIYIGAAQFGAREKASNSTADIATLAEEAHAYGVEVLVTLNTLLSEQERQDCIALARQLHAAGADAFIVQDMDLARALIAEGLRVHASTQMDNRTIEDVRQRAEMGCRRVVLARELSIEQIRSIRQAVPDIELEAFVHGAVCVCYSGRCYMSEVLMGRSANRGVCAQMCRMRYDLLDAEGNELTDESGQAIHQRYLLSLQDMDRSLYLRELIDAGVTTFKIEGRLKDADYVTNVVAYYRGLLDSICPREDAHRYRYNFVPNPEKTFHRGGTDYFLHGRTDHMANMRTPKSTGEYIGKVVEAGRGGRILTLALQDGIELHNGDGISIGDQGANVNGIQPRSGLTQITTSTPIAARAGEAVYRNLDIAFCGHLQAERRIPVDITLSATETGYRLVMQNSTLHREQEHEAEHIAAQNPEKAVTTARTQLAKLGDTRYEARRINIETTDFIPAGRLNEWRRQLTY